MVTGRPFGLMQRDWLPGYPEDLAHILAAPEAPLGHADNGASCRALEKAGSMRPFLRAWSRPEALWKGPRSSQESRDGWRPRYG